MREVCDFSLCDAGSCVVPRTHDFPCRPSGTRRRGLIDDAIWPQGRLRLDRLAAMATPRFSSPALRPFLAETRKSLRRHPPLRSRPDGCVVDRLRPLDRHRDRGGRGLEQPGRNHMATIGTFEHIGDSEYLVDIFTLSLRAKNVRIVSVSRSNENAPSHRIYIDQVEVGAGWSKRSNEGRDYLSVKLDDTLPAWW
jgi:uncharacterized protein (DUF736 family)